MVEKPNQTNQYLVVMYYEKDDVSSEDVITKLFGFFLIYQEYSII